VFNASALNSGQINQRVVAILLNVRVALQQAADLQGWAAGVSLADLEASGFSPADSAALLSAIADAGAVAQFYNTGLPPSTYPQPAGAPYVYAASQRQVIGPQ
jgi:hypothetical protein